ncbi:MAG TPA: thiamine pyrophosphate-dependent enzyme [Vitreimonas sp.]|uniref:thiamine pyrophosphate-dependent enzyme n=1 Tax=Vitreimonas sp. TaxID=3069702 RepID=UPI002D36DD91|nr:thiamine pyrophosphate-dependent enzyme [Vitreimonas sp.]HYD89284.1 thiamine pyrophosphate-dependent enzyme [Vitreimonas sp.]
MAQTAADVLVQSLIDWDVDVVFGMPGDGINGIIESLRRRQDEIRFIQTRHEESAAFMAVGYAKFTGKLGVCIATSGPGGIHLLNGLYDAKLDGAPVLAITGLQFHDLVGTLTQQDVPLDRVFMDVAAYTERVMGPTHVENVVELACRTALAYRTVAHVTVPVDIQSMPVKKGVRSERNIAGHVSDMMARGGQLPDDAQLRRAAHVLNAAQKPFILAGRGALRARAELEAVAEALGAPVGTALLGKGAIADDHPYATGGVGLLGTRASQEALEDCDTLLIVGSSFPYIEFYPKPGDARAVQIDIDPIRIGLRYPVEAGLVGDSARVLRALLPHLQRKADRSFLEATQKKVEHWRELMQERGERRDKPMKPQVVTHELDKLLAEDAIVTTDSGTVTTWVARQITMRNQRMFSCSGTLATMACGVPYAIAAAIAYPGRQVVAVVGDGAMAMLMGELATIKKYDLDVKIIVVKNDSLGQIKWEQMVFLGNPEYVCELEPIDFAKVAEACGLRGMTVEDPERCGEALRDAIGARGACLVEAVVDTHEPPMPPKVEMKQALHLAESLARGTPDRGKIAATIARDVVREMI